MSFVILCFNNREILRRCLEAVYGTIQGLTFEVIVVDNGSTDGSPEMLAREFPQVRVIRNATNLGWAAAGNQGLLAAQGRYSVRLDSDTEAYPGTFTELVAFMDQHPEVGVAGSKLLNPDGTAQATGRTFTTPAAVLFGRKSWLSKKFPNNRFSKRYLTCLHTQGDDPYPVDWVSGASMIVRREVIEQGLLIDDQRFFVFAADLDWCYEIRQAGWEIYYVPRSAILHNEGGTTKQRRDAAIIEFYRGMYQYYRKHFVRNWYDPSHAAAIAGLTALAILALARKRVVLFTAWIRGTKAGRKKVEAGLAR